jgi:hypothetical protein
LFTFYSALKNNKCTKTVTIAGKEYKNDIRPKQNIIKLSMIMIIEIIYKMLG